MIKVFPSDQKVVVINLTELELKKRLQEFIYLKPDHVIFSKPCNRKLIGRDSNGIWKVCLSPFLKHRIRPEIAMKFEKIDQSKTRLTFEFDLPFRQKVFLTIGCLFPVAFFISFLLSKESFEPWVIAIPFGLIGLSAFMGYVGFTSGHNQADKYINQMLSQIQENTL